MRHFVRSRGYVILEGQFSGNARSAGSIVGGSAHCGWLER